MNTVLFDLDGTLLPMDMKEFTDTYILLLKNRLETAGYDAKKIIAALWVGEKAVVQWSLKLKENWRRKLLSSIRMISLWQDMLPTL